jgi:hypothetical protein
VREGINEERVERDEQSEGGKGCMKSGREVIYEEREGRYE